MPHSNESSTPHRSLGRSATTRKLPRPATEMNSRHGLETTVRSPLTPAQRSLPLPTPRRRMGHVQLRITTIPGGEPAMNTHRSRAMNHCLLSLLSGDHLTAGLATRDRSHEPLPRRRETNLVSSQPAQLLAHSKPLIPSGCEPTNRGSRDHPLSTYTEVSVGLEVWVEPKTLPCHEHRERRACSSPECPSEQSARCHHRETPPRRVVIGRPFG